MESCQIIHTGVIAAKPTMHEAAAGTLVTASRCEGVKAFIERMTVCVTAQRMNYHTYAKEQRSYFIECLLGRCCEVDLLTN